MKAKHPVRSMLFPALSLGLALVVAGCASTDPAADGKPAPASSSSASRFKTDDGRTIDIGKASPADGGRRFSNPHMEKGKCWVADGLDLNAYDTLYIAPTLSTAKFPDKPADTMVHKEAKERLVIELARLAQQRKLFSQVVTQESDLKPGAKVLKLENTITEFSKGGGGARYWAGVYGAGQPVLRVEGKMSDGSKPVFQFEMRRSGVSGGARMMGAFMKDEDIQVEDIRSLALDLTDFLAALAGKYTPKH